MKSAQILRSGATEFMINRALILRPLTSLLPVLLVSLSHLTVMAQSTAALQGTVVDQSGAVVPNARILVRSRATAVERTTQTDNSGRYQVPALPVGSYRVEVQARGWQTQVVNNLTLEVSQTTIQNFQLTVGSIKQEMTVTAEAPLVETATITVGQVINQKTVQEVPLNGRHFVELGLLIPGSVTSPQDTNNLVTRPTRGQGASGFHTAGNRADTVNFMINGINLNDMATNLINFQPSIGTVQEFKVDNSTFSVEYGRNSGAIVNLATRSGSNQFHGEAFEFIRNEAFDARNFFDQTKPPFRRHQFGCALGGPIRKNRTFFFFTYEGLRQRQQLTMNSGVLSDAERAQVTDPAVRKLLDLIPRANAFVAGGPRFIGPASAPSDLDQWTGDVSHELTRTDHLHAYYAIQQDTRSEPTDGAATIPNFGDVFQGRHQVFTLNETHTFGSNRVNEVRLGFNRLNVPIRHKTEVNPADFAINNGITESIGLPQITVGGIGLSFGGPTTVPQGRADTTVVLSDTASYLHGPHSFKFGGEFRRFYSNLFSIHPGLFGFASPADFIRGNANSFSIVQGKRSSSIDVSALGLFVQDNFNWRSNVMLELGLRYEWNATPTERFNRFVVFDPTTTSLVRVGSGIDQIYHTNHKLQPRVGFAWDPFRTGKTSVRGAYAVLYDQPTTFMVGGLTTNPPFATPLTFTGPVRFDNALAVARASAVAPASVARDFDNAYVQSWNVNVQGEIMAGLGVMIGYFGSKGTHLLIFRNLNQITNGVRPFQQLSAASPILPGVTLGNITEADSAGNSSYNALWVAVNKRLSRGLQFNASYTWSKSLDYNSLSRPGVVVQDSFNLRGDRGLSDFDARHRFVINWLYELPWRGHRLVEGWQISGISQLQSGNPVNILAGNPLAIPGTSIGGASISSFTGMATIRPDLIGSVKSIGNPTQWFTNTLCDPRDPRGCPGAVFALPVKLQGGVSVFHFGNLGRNVIIGPGFSNTDFSVSKDTRLSEKLRLQIRAEIFDIFNHASFGQPGPIAQVGSSSFGIISNTRFPTGDSGSSRQIQFAVKLNF
jgi:hypothetical protein